jgi:hypothetical protein
MKTIKNELVRPYDVDGTLIVPYNVGGDYGRVIDIVDPVNNNKRIRMRVNEPMVRLMLEEKQRGGFIIVWSRSGFEWAANVIKAIGLEETVDLVMSKPVVYFDDMNVNEWLKDRVFIGPNERYKR